MRIKLGRSGCRKATLQGPGTKKEEFLGTLIDTNLAGPMAPSAGLFKMRGGADREATPGLCVQAISQAGL